LIEQHTQVAQDLADVLQPIIIDIYENDLDCLSGITWDLQGGKGGPRGRHGAPSYGGSGGIGGCGWSGYESCGDAQVLLDRQAALERHPPHPFAMAEMGSLDELR